MYYHDFINHIANALRQRDAEMVVQIQAKAKDYLLSADELDAIMNLCETAVESIETIEALEA